MSPNLENQMPENTEIEPEIDQIHLTLTPLSDISESTSLSDEQRDNELEESEEEEEDEGIPEDDPRSYVPLEHNVRELLVRVTNTERLETVTQLKLRVIAREIALQQLPNHLPALRELILEGSVISSLRDLGHNLRNLKVLNVNRCVLTCIDGVFGFENLEEFYATDNSIQDLAPCAFLSSLKVLDVRRNLIRSVASLQFLSLCPDLEHLLLEGNELVHTLTTSGSVIKRLLPQVILLDGAPLVEVEPGILPFENIQEDSEDISSSRTQTFNERRSPSLRRHSLRGSGEHEGGFTVRFPPRLCESSNNNH